MVSRFARLARAGVLAVVAVNLAAAAHVVAGGAVPSTRALVLTAGVVAAASAGALGVQAPPRRIVALVLTQQVALHLLFACAGLVAGALDTGSRGIAMSGMHMPGLVGPVSSRPGPSGSWAMLGEHILGDVSTARGVVMTVMHLVAAVGAGWWLAHGERLLWSLLVMLAAGVAAARMRGACALLDVVRARTAAGTMWSSALLRQRGGRWSVRAWERTSRLRLRGPPPVTGPDFA